MLCQFFKDESGQTLVEYGLVLAIISISVIAMMILLRGQIGAMLNSVTGTVSNGI